MHWSLPGHQCHNERASKIAPKLPPLPSACRWTWHSLVSWTWSYFFPPDDHHSDLEYVKLDLHPFFCKQVSNLAFLIESYFILTLFCIQVTSLAFCIELDLIFTFLCMQVAIMVFCTDLDFIVTLFCMKVISLAFWRELDLIIHHPLLLVGDFLGVLNWSKLDFQILFSACRWPPLRSGLSWTWSSPSCTLRWLP